MYANTNWDDEKSNRDQVVSQLQDYYKTLRRSILGEEVKTEDVPDPFRDAFLRAGERNRARFETPELPGEQAIRKLPA